MVWIQAVIGIVGLAIGYKTLQETKKGNQYGLIISVFSTIVLLSYMIYASPDSETKYDIVNHYEDGVLHYIGNGTFEHREDEWKWYSENGILVKIETYDNNKLDGKYAEYYENGNIKIKGEYDNGKKGNKWKCFNKNGSSATCS